MSHRYLKSTANFGYQLSRILLLAGVGTTLTAVTAIPGWTAGIKPSAMITSNPLTGSQNGTQTGTTAASGFIDDRLLDSLTFSGATFTNTTGQIRAVRRASVITNRSVVNAEFGDRDTSADGNPNPFVAAGYQSDSYDWVTDPSVTRETIIPGIQDAAITQAFNTRSISQGIDGEGANYTLRLVFQNGIVDNNAASDQAPELVFFERGVNSTFSVRAITGGTFNAPTYAPTTVNIATADLWNSGQYIDTIEINTGQELGVVGIDLNSFGINNTTTPIYGVNISSTGSTGADLYGNFLSAANTSQFRDVPSSVVPEPFTILGSGVALGFGVLMQRQRARKLKQEN